MFGNVGSYDSMHWYSSRNMKPKHPLGASDRAPIDLPYRNPLRILSGPTNKADLVVQYSPKTTAVVELRIDWANNKSER